MTTIYGDYARDKIGWFFGLSGWQLAILAVGFLPPCWAMSRGDWASAGILLLGWVAAGVVTVTEVWGRTALGWLGAAAHYAAGSLLGWTRFRAKATRGAVEDLDRANLPGVLEAVQIHDGPPHGHTQDRVAIIQDHANRTWAVTAAVVHPGLGMKDSPARALEGAGLSQLLDAACRGELVTEIIFIVRTVPDDGAERALYVRRHRRAAGPQLSRQVNDDLTRALHGAAVRTEAFATVVVPEARIARHAKRSGGGLDGRARVLYAVMAEVEAQLRGGVGMLDVDWLSSPELALACRTGFAPGDRAGVVEALAAREQDPGVNADVPWAMAGPSGADPAVRHYSHDAWNSVSATIKLPSKGAVMGALAPVLTPGEPGERRCFMVCYPILAQGKADRRSANSEWAADIGGHLRDKVGMRQRAKQRDQAATARGMDAKLARGNAMIRPYGVCTVTVPKTERVSEYAARLDASVRRAGFAPLRLDLAQDVAFIASTIPLGTSLARHWG
ncbi:SCO6880 family protein [Segeticoccus rhizosphaerae]|uniref:SCO6880 family protein n=1 Tax=Segeticoccus rhizosphaerae TaxID=1104777 RepID=UPI0010BFC2E9|nr:SCO6880 family protein [Ornithinicoccus soli]